MVKYLCCNLLRAVAGIGSGFCFDGVGPLPLIFLGRHASYECLVLLPLLWKLPFYHCILLIYRKSHRQLGI